MGGMSAALFKGRWEWQRPLVLALLAMPPLAASQGCSVEVSNTETVTRSHSPAPIRAAQPRALLSHAPLPEGEADDETDEQAWQSIRATLERPGDLRDGVLTFAVPRADLDVTIRGNEVPVGAGLASEFRFYRCTCGMINVLGQFVVADYEANDVLDALRDGHVEIASVGPFLLHERPRLMLIRFVGENKRGGALAKTLRAALSWTGEERMAPQNLTH